ncbi:DeoR/GlpR family DNA-binding transcription regulator [Pseudogracilibacillus auburnensis]|uniref:DeoR family transcriptional regulator n=1 Tax=Pseudogracilibacillus auburnensis TaxID=1494959 RepID=A0A2V3VIP7_9BACI|nr:DeoR/GlpR family DNA-binding transcription regulator [Pseudogracilibacillus auburnensis]MBO1002743.1 DeoR/GlpR transcriptional regulator [Pseudogracilibacillus auburnensis]PXW81712.1 DeoR family transcriptional regulator [Pseudogracilibacillus auburnensis]
MLTAERHEKIICLLKKQKIVKVQELVEKLQTSESTIRRDLVQLEKENKLKRVHGGASLIQQIKVEPSMIEKTNKNIIEKNRIAAYAASIIQDRDCVFLDAGTTINQMIPYINAKEITVVTNGLSHFRPLLERNIETYLLGGFIKPRTEALIGQLAMESLRKYRFDKTFIGVNGIHLDDGYTTPDPEEAAIKACAMKQGHRVFVLADHTKFHEVTFAHIANIEEAVIITNETHEKNLNSFKEKTTIEVVET